MKTYCYLPIHITDVISLKRWKRLITTFDTDEFPAFLNLVSHIQFTDAKPSQNQRYILTLTNNECFFRHLTSLFAPNYYQQQNKTSITTAIVIILAEQSTKIDTQLFTKAKKYVKSQQFHINVQGFVYGKLIKSIPDLYCPSVEVFQILSYDPRFSNHNGECAQCYGQYSLREMGLITGYRLTCLYCKPQNGNVLCRCTLCYCYFGNYLKHQCTSPNIWSCKGCLNSFQSRKMPNSLCDHCFLQKPPFESRNYPLTPNDKVIVPKTLSEIITTCSICFQNSTQLTLLCTNQKCFSVGCQTCFKEWYTQKGDGFEFFVNKTRCPFCKTSPNFRTTTQTIHDNIALGKTLDLYKKYATCSSCFNVTQINQRCDDHQEIENFVCDVCQNWDSGVLSPKLCPSCGVCIEKDGGCNHITCSVCQTHWCYLCRSKLDPHMGLYNHQCRVNQNSNRCQIYQYETYYAAHQRAIREVVDNKRLLIFVFIIALFFFLIVNVNTYLKYQNK